MKRGAAEKATRRLTFREVLTALGRMYRLRRENRKRQSRLDKLNQERSAAYLALALLEEGRPGAPSSAERQCVTQALQHCLAARERHAAASRTMERFVLRVDAAQTHCEQALAEAQGSYRSVNERLRGGGSNDETRGQAGKAAQRIDDLRRTWQASYAGAREEGMALNQALHEAERALAADEETLAEARRKLGAAVFAAGAAGSGEEGARIRTLETDSARLEAETAQAAETLRTLAPAGRRAAILLTLVLLLLIGSTVTYRVWRRASSRKDLENWNRPDREKSTIEKEAEQEIEPEELHIAD